MITFYDNGGASIDRYTMCEKEGELYHFYSYSTNALEPLGFDQYSHTGELNIADTSHLGEQIDWSDLPLSVKIACLRRLDPQN